jgi:3-methylfumaryl-CoA hydratase
LIHTNSLENTMVSEYAQLEQYIGVKHITEDVITASQVHRLSLTLNRHSPMPKTGDAVPWGWHFIFFPRLVHTDQLSPDGLSAEFEGCPDSPLPKRMFVGNNLKFHEPLRIGDHATKEIYIKSVTPKTGRSGRLVFVNFAIQITGPRGLVLEDEHMMVFKDDEQEDSQASVLSARASAPPSAWQRTLTLDEVTLFRYSAVTFNPHRIHYDQPYTVNQENYSGLVVQGGLTSILLLELLHEHCKDRPFVMDSYSMRAKAPLFASQAITLSGQPSIDGQSCQLWASNDQGQLAMEIAVKFK